jgi:cold shock CspA family protein
MTRLAGKVKFYRPAPANFGFIQDEMGKDYFFSIVELKNSGIEELRGIGRGDRVAFTPVMGPKGMKATEIKMVKPNNHGQE